MNYNIPNAYCKKCDSVEPEDWDFEKEGLWFCECRPVKLLNIDTTLEKIANEINNNS